MPQTTIFQAAPAATETISGAGALLRWSTNDDAANGSDIPFMVNAFNARYGRAITAMYPINTAEKGIRKINIVGQATGTLTLGGIMSYSIKGLSEFLAAVSSTCGDKSVTISLQPTITECKDNGQAKTNGLIYTLRGVALVQIDISIQSSQDGVAYVSQPLTFTFTDLMVNTP